MPKKNKRKLIKIKSSLRNYHLKLQYLAQLVHLYNINHYLHLPVRKHINTRGMEWYALKQLDWAEITQEHNHILIYLNKRGLKLIKNFVPKRFFVQQMIMFIIAGLWFILSISSIIVLVHSTVFMLLPIIVMSLILIYSFMYCAKKLGYCADNVSLDKYLHLINIKPHRYIDFKNIVHSYKHYFCKAKVD